MEANTKLTANDLYQGALSGVVNLFATIGFTANSEIDGTEASMQIAEELEEEALLVLQVRTQKVERKAEQSYEQNMQGFGETFTTSFYNTATSGFGGGFASHPGRPQSAIQRSATKKKPMFNGGLSDDEFEEHAQNNFEESMRDTSVAFF